MVSVQSYSNPSLVNCTKNNQCAKQNVSSFYGPAFQGSLNKQLSADSVRFGRESREEKRSLMGVITAFLAGIVSVIGMIAALWRKDKTEAQANDNKPDDGDPVGIRREVPIPDEDGGQEEELVLTSESDKELAPKARARDLKTEQLVTV